MASSLTADHIATTLQPAENIAGYRPRGMNYDNWDRPPYNGWSFQHVRELFPTAPVEIDPARRRVLPSATVELDHLTYHRTDGDDETIGALLARTHTDAFLAVHRGQIVIEHYFGAMTAATTHISQSVSKSLVGALVGNLIDRGMLDPAAPVTDYVPELKTCGYAGATIRHLLDMTSGVGFSETYGDPASEVWAMDVCTGWRPDHDGRGPASLHDLILSLKQIRPHGERFDYRSVETDVLGWVLERRTGLALPKLMSEILWQPLGCEAEAYFTLDKAGIALASGGFAATARDYARFGLMMLSGGWAGDRQLVSADWVAACGRGEQAKFGAPYAEWYPEGAYSNQFWVEDCRRGSFMARGIYGQLIYIDPVNELVAVKLSAWPDYRMVDLLRDTLAGIR
ncbi:MAG TPA: serine hydrolase, partial [Terriglobales bacterium]|nr:serine hydrolase [Terriglobales bacterium]